MHERKTKWNGFVALERRMGNKVEEEEKWEEEDEEGHKGKSRRRNKRKRREKNQKEHKEGVKKREKQIPTTTIGGSTQSPRATRRGSTQSAKIATPCYKSFLNFHLNVISSFFSLTINSLVCTCTLMIDIYF